MFRVPELRRGPTDAAPGANEVLRVQGSTAVVALVPSGSGVLTMGTGPLNVAVGSEPSTVGTVGQEHGVLVDVILLQKGEEQLVHHLAVILCAGGGEDVKANAHAPPGVQELRMVLVHHLLRLKALLLSADGYGSTMLVTARDHQHLVTFYPVVSGEDVRRQIAACQVA